MHTQADSPSSTVSLHGSFGGHETFTFRYGWLKKGVDGLEQQPDIFGQESAMVQLGVGKNMVRSIRHWCLATQVIREGETLPGCAFYLRNGIILALLHPTKVKR